MEHKLKIIASKVKQIIIDLTGITPKPPKVLTSNRREINDGIIINLPNGSPGLKHEIPNVTKNEILQYKTN